MHHPGPAESKRFLDRKSGVFMKATACVCSVAFGVGGEQDFGYGIGQRAKALLAFAQSLLGALTLGVVAEYHDQAFGHGIGMHAEPGIKRGIEFLKRDCDAIAHGAAIL